MADYYASYVKSYLVRDVGFYRDSQKREIDLVIQDGRMLHPVEIKAGVQPGRSAVKSFSCLEGVFDYEVGFGHVIRQTPEPYLVSEGVQAVPLWAV